jgi:hypothetical protein
MVVRHCFAREATPTLAEGVIDSAFARRTETSRRCSTITYADSLANAWLTISTSCADGA